MMNNPAIYFWLQSFPPTQRVIVAVAMQPMFWFGAVLLVLTLRDHIRRRAPHA